MIDKCTKNIIRRFMVLEKEHFKCDMPIQKYGKFSAISFNE
jgi:hypothetical protein